jgi:hypothetical protein
VSNFSVDDILSNPDASPVERVVSVCVAGKLVSEHQELEVELERAQDADMRTGARLSGTSDGGNTTELARKIRDLEERMRSATYTFRFRAVTPEEWSNLITAHPDDDEKRLFDPETFPPAAIAKCCYEPAGMNDPAKVAELMQLLSPAQQADLFDGAWEVNTSAPKELNSYSASAALRNYETNLSSSANAESPAALSSGE